MPISNDLKKFYASGGDAIAVEVLRFKHPGFTKTWHLTNHYSDTPLTLKDETGASFKPQYIPFEVKLPIHDGQGRQDLSIVIGNIGRELVAEIESANKQPEKPIECTFLVYFDSGPTEPQSDPIHLSVTNPTIDALTVTLSASRFDVLNKPFPASNLECVYNTSLWPGLDR